MNYIDMLLKFVFSRGGLLFLFYFSDLMAVLLWESHKVCNVWGEYFLISRSARKNHSPVLNFGSCYRKFLCASDFGSLLYKSVSDKLSPHLPNWTFLLFFGWLYLQLLWMALVTQKLFASQTFGSRPSLCAYRCFRPQLCAVNTVCACARARTAELLARQIAWDFFTASAELFKKNIR